MKINYQSIEFFGTPGVGKSYSEKKLKYLLKKRFIVLNRREIVTNYAKNCIDLNFTSTVGSGNYNIVVTFMSM